MEEQHSADMWKKLIVKSLDEVEDVKTLRRVWKILSRFMIG